jgi:pyridoxal phosphate enzyme (YggS family)
LQSNKIKLLAQIPNLYAIHSIESQKHADAVNKAFNDRNPPLNVFVQVNTSQEQSKHGSDRQSALDLAKHIINNCSNVKFMGFMTIGAPDRSESERPNPDFVSMQECRDALLKDFTETDCFLSMGMSSDYEHAIEMGSSFVRVGSSIFGARNYAK